MTEISRFNGKDAYTASEFAEVFSSAFLDGVDVANNPHALEVAKDEGGGGLAIRVEPGIAWVRGTWYRATEPLGFPLEPLPTAKSSGKPTCRYDRVVLRATRAGQDGGWDITTALNPGEITSPDSIPTTPPSNPAMLARGDTIWETPLAGVLVVRKPGDEQKDEIVALFDERDHIVTLSFVVTFTSPGGIAAPGDAEVVVPFGCVPLEISAIADASLRGFGLSIAYRAWDGFAAGEPPSQTPVPILDAWTITTDAVAVSTPIAKPSSIPRHAILRVTLTPKQPALAPPQVVPLPTRVTVQIGAIRADVSR